MSVGDVIILKRNEVGYSVQCGILSEDRLCPEEALWCVVGLITGSGKGFLRTPIEHAIWNAKYNCPKNLLTAGDAS